MIQVRYPWERTEYQPILTLSIAYPWQSLIEQTAATQLRHKKGNIKGGQFAKNEDIGAGLPSPVAEATQDFAEMNRKRVALAKAKRQLKKFPDSQEYKDKVKRLAAEHATAKTQFELSQTAASNAGFQVNKLGKWTNKTDAPTVQPAPMSDRRLEDMSREELQSLRSRIDALLGESDSANKALASENPQPVHGHVVTVYGSDPNTKYQMRYEIRELDDLITSNTDSGSINPDFPAELQPRDRSRLASKVQIDSIAKKLEPDALLDEFKAIDRGTPIIGDDNVVESGNGRSMALRRARQEYPEQFDAYQQRLKQTAIDRGIDPARLEGFTNPVLVRVRQTDVDREQFAKDANTAQILSTSDSERAKSDASRISSSHLQNLDVKDTIDQTLRSGSNRDFVINFVGNTPETERATMMTKDGQLTQSGENRIKAAMFNRVYDSPELSDRIFETTDNDIKNITNGVMNSLGPMSRAEELVRTGQRGKDLSIAGDVSKAIQQYASLKATNVSVENYLNQGQLFGRELTPVQEKILVEFDKRKRSGKQVKDMMDTWSLIIEKEPHPGQGSLFGDASKTKDELVDEWLRRANETPPEQGSLF